MNHSTEILNAVGAVLGQDCPRYAEVFTRAIRRTPPIFFRQKYSDFFWHCIKTIPGWLPRVVLSCATTESSGAHALLDIWSRVNYHAEAEAGLARHARDESRHARMFIELARLCFPRSYEAGVLETTEGCLAPIVVLGAKREDCLIPEDVLIDYLLQLNIVEMRTRIHLHLLAPAYYALAPQDAKPRVERLLQALARDEIGHVAYTAQLLDTWIASSAVDRDTITELYALRMADYNEHTVDHCDSSVHDYGQGVLPDLISD